MGTIIWRMRLNSESEINGKVNGRAIKNKSVITYVFFYAFDAYGEQSLIVDHKWQPHRHLPSVSVVPNNIIVFHFKYFFFTFLFIINRFASVMDAMKLSNLPRDVIDTILSMSEDEMKSFDSQRLVGWIYFALWI